MNTSNFIHACIMRIKAFDVTRNVYDVLLIMGSEREGHSAIVISMLHPQHKNKLPLEEEMA